jgi:hypothetical protein
VVVEDFTYAYRRSGHEKVDVEEITSLWIEEVKEKNGVVVSTINQP